jgi:signal transduction histidine kinase
MLLRLQSILHNIRHVSLAKFSVENLLKGLETAEQQSHRLSRMINDLLNISLITTGKFNLERERTNLADLVKEVVSEFSEKLEADGYYLELKTDEPVICYVDKLRIEQVISNLLSNAVKYGNQKPIEIKVEKNSHNAKISVKDHGIGIHKSNANRLFMLFERGVADDYKKGLGVGLYIANQIIKAHKGTIKVKSRPNFGSEFTLELPLRS